MGLFSRLLRGGTRYACAKCSKPLRPFGQVGTASGASLPKIEHDHGFACERCHQTVCPACAGQRAAQLGLREFVCTSCGHTPLHTLIR
jgi:DNA-directed RNA polymerase subunit RPC12/RpoP